MTGGGQGIGRAIAERLLASGASVSIWHGVSELIGGEQAAGRDYTLAYAVLGISFVLEGISFFVVLTLILALFRL